jgi:hypothetical protein
MRTLKFTLLLAIFSVAFFSCKKTTTETPPANSATVDKLTAKEWLGDSVRVQANASTQIPDGIDQRFPITAARMTLNKDKTFSAKFQENATAQTGTWELLENDTKIKLSGGFETSINQLIAGLLPALEDLLPANVSISGITLPPSYELKTLTDTKLVMKGVATINLTFLGFPIGVPVNMEVSFKR